MYRAHKRTAHVYIHDKYTHTILTRTHDTNIHFFINGKYL